MKLSAWLLAAAPAAALIACFSDGTGPQNDAGTTLPCDVANALSACQACHGAPPTESAPFSLATYQDLTQVSPQYSDQTVAQRVVARMGDGTWPMPPHPLDATPQTDIDTIQAWIDQGYPAGTCTVPPGGTDPFATDPTCTNGKTTIFNGNILMRPGETCVSCHVKDKGPVLAFAGTVYPTAHEPDDCRGTNVGGAIVTVTDSATRQFKAVVNTAGNFYVLASATANLKPPYTVKLAYQGRERDMTGLVTAPTDGDCNACHTETGDQGAPGRILLP